MSKNDKPKARKLKFDKKNVRKLDTEELKKAGGGLRPEGDDEGGTAGQCGCPSGFRCCYVNHNQALRA